MASYKARAIRMPDADWEALQRIADRLGQQVNRRLTPSDVARMAIEDYIRRNG